MTIGAAMFSAEAFANLLEKHNMSQADICRATGLSAAYLSTLSKGNIKDPSLGKSLLIAHALGMTLDDFYDRTME